MKPTAPSSGINRRVLLSTLALLPALSGPLLPVSALAQTPGGLLPSWNEGPAKQAIFDFVRATIDRSSPSYVIPEDRVAVFDQDGTLWVEHPMYTQVVYCLERVPAAVRTSCASMPTRSTASRPSRWSAPRVERNTATARTASRS